MAYLTDFYQALRDQIVAALPELDTAAGGGGVWQALEMTRQDFKKVIDLERLPFSTMNFKPLSSDAYPPGAQVDVYTVEISYTLGAAEDVDVEAMAERLVVLRDYLWTRAAQPLGEHGQIMHRGTISTDLDLASNRFFANARWPYFAGAVILPEVIIAQTY